MGAGQQCDEFPYWTTAETNKTTMLPSLRPVDGPQNVEQGRRLGTFVYSHCHLETAPPGSEGRKYIVVVSAIVPTVGICGKK